VNLETVCSTKRDHLQQLLTLSSRYVSGRVVDSMGSGSRRAKMTHKKKIKKLIILFFEVLDVLF
jgi:hypothetical protein